MTNVNQVESTSEALLVGSAVCPDCGGCGVIQVPITVAGCCGKPNKYGDCCGDPIPVQDWDIEQCPCQYRPSLTKKQEDAMTEGYKLIAKPYPDLCDEGCD